MTKSEKVISLRQKLNQTSTLAWKVKVDSIFYLATFPNNYCLHNASYMTQWVLTPATTWSVLVRAGPTCTFTGKLVIEANFYISGMKNVKFLVRTCHEMCFRWSYWSFWSKVLNSYFDLFCFKTNIHVCQIDMNIPILFMELHEIITFTFGLKKKYLNIWIKIIQRTHQPWMLLSTILNN